MTPMQAFDNYFTEEGWSKIGFTFWPRHTSHIKSVVLWEDHLTVFTITDNIKQVDYADPQIFTYFK